MSNGFAWTQRDIRVEPAGTWKFCGRLSATQHQNTEPIRYGMDASIPADVSLAQKQGAGDFMNCAEAGTPRALRLAIGLIVRQRAEASSRPCAAGRQVRWSSGNEHQSYSTGQTRRIATSTSTTRVPDRPMRRLKHRGLGTLSGAAATAWHHTRVLISLRPMEPTTAAI